MKIRKLTKKKTKKADTGILIAQCVCIAAGLVLSIIVTVISFL